MFKSLKVNSIYDVKSITIIDDDFTETFPYHYNCSGWAHLATAIYNIYLSKNLDVVKNLYRYICFERDGRENALPFDRVINYMKMDFKYLSKDNIPNKIPDDVFEKLKEINSKLEAFQ